MQRHVVVRDLTSCITWYCQAIKKNTKYILLYTRSSLGESLYTGIRSKGTHWVINEAADTAKLRVKALLDTLLS